MNPLTKVKLVSELNERETHIAAAATASWHSEYKDSAWIFVGGLPFELTEGDILCVFSQYGEIVNINLVRDQKTGKSKGFCFICYEDQRSTVLAVDNFNGIKIKGRTIRVDHVSCYRPPRVLEGVDDATRKLWQKGCGIQTSSSSSSEGSEDEALSEHHKQEKQKRSKTKERTTILVKDEERQTQQPLFLAARGQIKMEDTLGSDERAKVKLESREGRKHQPSCPEARKTAVVDSFLQGAEGSGEWTQGGESKF